MQKSSANGRASKLVGFALGRQRDESGTTSFSLRKLRSFFMHEDRANRYIIVIAWIAIIFGVAFRLTQLPTRAIYFDEAYTFMRVAGHTETELWQTLYTGRPTTAVALRADATVDAHSSAGLLVASLVKEDSQHPPLFYLAELFIVKIFGNSLVVWRILPALFGILAIAATFALARELFADPRAPLLAAAVIAVSPIQRIYSEQAREYSLLVLLVLLSTLAVVRAVRANSVAAWSLYVVCAAAGLYASPFMGYVIVAHAVFALIPNRRRGRSIRLSFVGAAACAVVIYAPWLAIIAMHRDEITKTNLWSAEHWPFARLAAKWVFNVGSTFFDLEYIDLRWSVVFAAIALLAVAAVVRGFRASNATARWCLSAAILVPALLLAAPDIVLGEHRSSVARYALPALTILSILIARGLIGRPIATTLILASGLLASASGSLHASWWDNDRNADDARIAAIINSAPRAQVISDIPPGSVVAFTRLFNDDVRLSLSGNLAQVQFSRFDPLFVLWPKSGDLIDLERRTGVNFIRVPFKRTVTAHDLGTHIGSGGATNDETADLYQAVDQRMQGQ